MTALVAPYPIAVAQAELDDLARRLADTRWPDAGTVADHRQGPQRERIAALVARWQTGYDWRATEALLNGWNSSRTEIDGLGIQFLHVRSPQADALPLLMTHGWPGSVLEFRDVIGPLTDPVAHGGDPADAFHLVIPALPGFGFSDKPAAPGWGVGRTASAWASLMSRLGYDARWAAQGGDWGAAITTALGHMRPPGLLGIHLNMVMFQPTDAEIADATPDERRMLADAKRYETSYAGYMKLQSTHPQSVAFGLADSPAGLAAWIYALFQDVSDSGGAPEDVIALDHLIDDIMLYWLPNAGPSSARFYWEAAQEMSKPMPTGPMTLPTGISMFSGEQVRLSRRWAESRFEDLRFFGEADRGGHFAALENPKVFVEHLRETFRQMR
ncbi:epoxide hydrolase [Luteimonas sp. 3794]|uniref:epoxide hydrolase family protein n=1 Tax=Luteimonas sp. 3794 TaxID=2817730 RepID=UPI00285DD7A5|nr:epoxide hydrolase [Luteimonas sp. 3794]MDR6990276.1 microsomal epoxide hydrolase [Luteimonas sp. 3794]